MEFQDSRGNIHILPKGMQVAKRLSCYPVVFNEKHELLLFMPTYNPQWQLPGGGMDVQADESAKQTAERECLEETGYHIRVLSSEPIYIGKQNFYHNGEKKFYFSELHFFNAELLSTIPDEVSEEDKGGKVAWQLLSNLYPDNTHSVIQPVLKILKEEFDK